MINLAEWLPDQAPLVRGTQVVQNVTPITDSSYGPVGALVGVGSALDGMCKGAVSYRGQNGIVGTFAGTADKLYRWNGTDFDDVTRASGSYATPDEEMWDFAQFGDYVVAVNGLDEPQVYQLGVSSKFDALSTLGDTPPVARFAETVRDFEFLARLSTGQNVVKWSGLNNIGEWTPGTNQSDEQELPTGGRIMGIVGGQYALVICETSIHRFVYTGDSNIIFQRDEISIQRGAGAEGSIANFQDKVFFWSWDGFFMMSGGGEPFPIGDQKVDRWFSRNVNQAYLYRISGTVDPLNKLYVVSFVSIDSADGRCDKQLRYNWTVGRWTLVDIQTDIVAPLLTNVGYTGDNFPDATGASSPDDPGVLSPDSSLLTGSPKGKLGAFGQDNKMAFFEGDNLEATMETVEGQITDNARTMVNQVWPQVDGGTISVSLGTRDRLNDAQTWSPYVNQGAVGYVPFRSNARFHQARLKVAAGSNWTHAVGINVGFGRAGWR